MRTALILFLDLLLACPLSAQENRASVMLSGAIYEEEVSGNLDKAIELYLDILKKYPDDRPVAAKALYHLGLVNEKLGRQKAADYYTRLVNTYPEQKEMVALARIRLLKSDEKNSFTDPRDGHKYRYVTIGEQTWMAENLAYLPKVVPASEASDSLPLYYVYGYDGSNTTEAKSTGNYTKSGVLYNWPAAMNGGHRGQSAHSLVQGICPPGWHLSSNDEWIQLLDFVGTDSGKKLKSVIGWSQNGNGDGTSGFDAIPGGKRVNDEILTHLGLEAAFWTYSLATDPDPHYFSLSSAHSFEKISSEKTNGFSVRCVRDYPVTTVFLSATHHTADVEGCDIKEPGDHLIKRGFLLSLRKNKPDRQTEAAEAVAVTEAVAVPGAGTGTFRATLKGLTPDTVYYVRAYLETDKGILYGNQLSFRTRLDTSGTFRDDRDGRKYKWVKIGKQIWMAENLAWLPAVYPVKSESDSVPYYYVYGYNGFDTAEARAHPNYATCGVLYNWAAARNGESASNKVPSGVQGICPDGWHLPGDKEWKMMEIFLGMDEKQADSLGFRPSGRVDIEIKTKTGWTRGSEGNGHSGFEAYPAGARNVEDYGFTSHGRVALFWTSSESSRTRVWDRILYTIEPPDPKEGIREGISRGVASIRFGMSVRCVRNNGL